MEENNYKVGEVVKVPYKYGSYTPGEFVNAPIIEVNGDYVTVEIPSKLELTKDQLVKFQKEFRTESKEVKIESKLNLNGLEDKYKKVIDQLYEDGYIFDTNNIDEETKQAILENGYTEEDYSIKVEETDEGYAKVSIPFVYGNPETTVSKNYIIFFDDYVQPSEFGDVDFPYEYDGVDDEYVIDEEELDTNWIKLEDIETLEERMADLGI